MNDNVLEALDKYNGSPSGSFNSAVIRACQKYLETTTHSSFNGLVREAANKYSGVEKIAMTDALYEALLKYTGLTSGSLNGLINAAAIKYITVPPGPVVPTYEEFEAHIASRAVSGPVAWGNYANDAGAYRTTVGAPTGSMFGSSWGLAYVDASWARVVQHGLPDYSTLLALAGKEVFVRTEGSIATMAFSLNRNEYLSNESDFGGTLPVCLCRELLFYTDRPYSMNPSTGTGPTPYTW